MTKSTKTIGIGSGIGNFVDIGIGQNSGIGTSLLLSKV